jgi:outer membrane protein assembly factor BamB
MALHRNAFGQTAAAPARAATAAGAPLGSPDFMPTPDRPVGWRGDSSGRFPAASPPLEWYRRPKGAFNAIHVSAAKPKGTAAEGQELNMGMIREWLVAGPFDAKDHATALDDVTQPNEAALAPAVGEDLAGKQWKAIPVLLSNQSETRGHLCLDLAVAFGKTDRQEWQNHPGTMDPLVAYACAYLHSPEAVQVQLRLEGQATRAWINGAPVKAGKNAPTTLDLKAGWNTLLVKAASDKKAWNLAATLFPLPATGYETKNIVWMAPMPGQSWSSPIIVGSKIFANADEGTLVCLNKEDGRVLWARSTTFYSATTDEERKKFPDLAAKAEQLDKMMLTLPEDLNAGLSPDGSKADANAALQNKIKQKVDLEKSIRETMGKADKAYNCWNNDRGWAIATPVSDGKHVYVAYYGGQKGIGANAVACFDVDGKRVWSYFTGQTGINEHGQHSTPALSGDYLVYLTGTHLLCFEKATGKLVWDKKTAGFGNVTAASLVAAKAGNVDVVLAPHAGIFRVSDGAELWKSDLKDDTVTPCLVDGVIYGPNYGFSAVETKEASFYAMRLPAPSGNSLTPEFLVKVPWKNLGMKLAGGANSALVGSPLYNDGLVYVVSEGGGLTVVDAKTGKLAYTKALEALNPRLTWVFVVGVCTGPTLAGKNIHIRDDQGQTLVIAPGTEYKELAKNVLWELQGDRGQQESQSNPWYEAGRMYYRTQGYLYCVGEK